MDAQRKQNNGFKLAGKYAKEGGKVVREAPVIGFWGRLDQENDSVSGEEGDDFTVKNIVTDVTEVTATSKKKTPKERRSSEVTVNKGKISVHQKRNFKENFNTDKTRLEKRQLKLDRPQDFLLLVKDNIHEDGGGSKTAGKYMVCGKGAAKDMFLNGGIAYSREGFYMHENNTDFTEEIVEKDAEKEDEKDSEPAKKRPRRKIFPSSLVRQLESGGRIRIRPPVSESEDED